MKYEVKFTNRYKRELKLMKKRGMRMELLENVINLLREGKPLPLIYNDHPLEGNYKGFRECHIKPDWLLIYLIQENILVLTLMRTGTHSDLF